MFQDKWLYCVLFFLSQLIFHSQSSMFGCNTGVGRRKRGVFCHDHQPRYPRIPSPLRPSLPLRIRAQVTVQAKSSPLSEFLNLFLVKFVGGVLAFPLSVDYVEKPMMLSTVIPRVARAVMGRENSDCPAPEIGYSVWPSPWGFPSEILEALTPVQVSGAAQLWAVRGPEVSPA